MFCSQCGKQNSDQANFCQYCGSAMMGPSPSPVGQVSVIDPVVVSQAEHDEAKSKNGLAIIGLIAACIGLGLSVVFYMIGGMLMGIPLCVAGIVLSAISLKRAASKALSITGLIIGIVGAVLGFFMMLVFFALLDNGWSFAYFIEEMLEELLEF